MPKKKIIISSKEGFETKEEKQKLSLYEILYEISGVIAFFGTIIFGILFFVSSHFNLFDPNILLIFLILLIICGVWTFLTLGINIFMGM